MTHPADHRATSGTPAFTPSTDGTVDIPPVTDPRHMQAAEFWARFFDCSTASVTEVHARLGRRPLIPQFAQALKRLKLEEEFADTSSASTRQLGATQPATVPVPLSPPARAASRVAAWLNRRGTT